MDDAERVWNGLLAVRGTDDAVRDDGEHAYDLAAWAQDMLTIAVVHDVSRRTPEGEVLSIVDTKRVLARLSTDAFSLRDLPF